MCINAEINFGKLKDKNLSKDKIDDLIPSYITQLQRRGQIGGTEYNWYTIKGEIRSFVSLSHPKALLKRYHSEWCKETISELKKVFGSEPQWRIADDCVPSKFPKWQSAKALVLFTTMFEYLNCVYALDTKEKIPLYQLPLKDQEIEGIHWWISSYQLHDEMWIHSGKLEIPAYKQLVEVSSELNEEGRNLSSVIEKATGIPTYYYLMRYWGRKKGEENRKCPGCGMNWRNKEIRIEDKHSLGFHYICKQCRLASHFPDSLDNERYAKLGE